MNSRDLVISLAEKLRIYHKEKMITFPTEYDPEGFILASSKNIADVFLLPFPELKEVIPCRNLSIFSDHLAFEVIDCCYVLLSLQQNRIHVYFIDTDNDILLHDSECTNDTNEILKQIHAIVLPDSNKKDIAL